MPTGYTAAISEGITFKDFALQCARAFGACIEMRDEPTNAPIPDEFKPSDYHTKQIKVAEHTLAAVRTMTTSECSLEAIADYEREVEYHKRGIEKAADLDRKYMDMLLEVGRWQPPSSEHSGLKNFMQEQITDSVKFDCNRTYHDKALAKLFVLSGEDWRVNKVAEAERDIAYHAAKQDKETERASNRTQWVRQLKASL